MGLGTVGEGNIHSASQDGAVMLRSRDRAADLAKVALFTETPSGRADQDRALHQPHWNTLGSLLPRRAGPLWWCHGARAACVGTNLEVKSRSTWFSGSLLASLLLQVSPRDWEGQVDRPAAWNVRRAIIKWRWVGLWDASRVASWTTLLQDGFP
jgi:hypothetical protein